MGTSQTSPGKPNYRGLDLEKQISTGVEIVHTHRFSADRGVLSSLRERQASVVESVNHGSIRGSWPMAISGYPRGLCQEDEKSSCCTKDEGGPFGAAL